MKNSQQRRDGKKLVAGFALVFAATAAFVVPAIGLAEKSQVRLRKSGDQQSVDLSTYCRDQKCSQEFKDALSEAQNGNANAENKVGVMLHFADGVKQNYSEALKWYLRATDKKHAEAANHIGRIYLNGEGQPKDATKACEWYVKSGEWGHVWGMMNAASCYKFGHRGFEKDDAKAAEWYARAEKAQPGVYKQHEERVAESQKERPLTK